jgi:hypothetical protein
VEVIGMETRSLGPENIRNYFVLEFYPTQANFNNAYTPHHISLLEEDTLLKLEKMINLLYPQELKCQPICHIPKAMLSESEYTRNYSKRT